MKTSIIFLLVLSLTALAFTCSDSRSPPPRSPPALPAPRLLLSGGTCNVTFNVEVSFYGYPTNDPPGFSTSLDCDGRTHLAGGTGTYDDPLTFATEKSAGDYAICEIVFLPYLQKYLIHEQICANCTSQSNNIFVWIESGTMPVGTLADCYTFLGTGTNNLQGVVREPLHNLPVDVDHVVVDGECNTRIMHINNPMDFCGIDSGPPAAPASAPAVIASNPPAGGPSNPPPGGPSNPPEGSCSWPGHCQGASCGTDDDCADPFICMNGSCA